MASFAYAAVLCGTNGRGSETRFFFLAAGDLFLAGPDFFLVGGVAAFIDLDRVTFSLDVVFTSSSSDGEPRGTDGDRFRPIPPVDALLLIMNSEK